MFVITPTSGSQIAASSAIWPAPRIASSSTSTSVPNGAARISSGIPISVLKFAREAAILRCGVIIAAIRSLVVVFPTEPGDRDHEGGEVLAPGPRERAQRRQRQVGGDDRALELARQQLVDPLRLDHDAPRAGLERGDGERAAVDLLARQAEEEVARLDPARVDDRAPGPARGAPAGLLAVQRAADRPRDALDAPVPHAPTAPAAPRGRP